MPTYQYACTDCGERTEKVQKFTDEPLTVCPVCGGKLRKVFSPVGIVFKGSGFYRTDSRNGSVTANGRSKEKEKVSTSGESSGSSSGDSSGSSSSASKSDSGSSGDKSSSGASSSSSKSGSSSGASSSSGSKVA